MHSVLLNKKKCLKLYKMSKIKSYLVNKHYIIYYSQNGFLKKKQIKIALLLVLF